MTRENALFIANVLEEELKDETANYNSNHTEWVKQLIKATISFFEENNFYRWELNRLIREYNETKQWNERDVK